MKKILVLLPFLFLTCKLLPAQEMVSLNGTPGAFDMAGAASIFVDENDATLIHKTARLLQQDITSVTGKTPLLVNDLKNAGKRVIIIGSINGSSLINKLAQEKKIDLSSIKGKWEAYAIRVVSKPLPGVDQALLIAGSDRRGTAYGVFNLSGQIGVSPWYWWADVPVKKKAAVYINSGRTYTDAPKVKYRGIFINDEAPALSGWSREKFGGFNHLFYEKVFELILRLKGNYLWPAMWGNAFYDDDSLNKKSADDYGIVIGTSHHEPLMRAHDEWRRYGKGKWNYDSNAARLKTFWEEGIRRTEGTETIVSVGMRGDGDEPMTEGTAIALLEKIVQDQRSIINHVTGKPASESPQLWALYKEVQDYYDNGMRVPDDITLLLADDNWGNIRKLPKLDEKKRKGGYGIYYHFDYVGGPRNYKWLNTNNLSRVWEQMNLAWNYGARQIWIVNVGDIKPMELPITFFLDQAWNPEKFSVENITAYYTNWAAKQFNPKLAAEIGEVLRTYAQYSARRKPELLSPETYSLHHYNEWEKVLTEQRSLLQKAEAINKKLKEEEKDAFYQLVLHPVKALANLHELYYAVAMNRYLASGKLAVANEYADKAKEFYLQDSLITLEYHRLGNGKWNHMMAQTHIGYTYWQQPSVNQMPLVRYINEEEALPDLPAIDSTVRSAKDMIPNGKKGKVFYEFDGYAAMEAAHWTRAVNTGVKWKVIPGIGKTHSGITIFPVTAARQTPKGSSAHTEYDVYVYDSGSVTVQAYFSPTLNFLTRPGGMQYAISIDNEPPQVLTINKDEKDTRTWEGWVADNIIIQTSKHVILKPGKHTVKYWMVDPGVVLQRIVLDFGGAKQTYLGPPETKK